MFAIDAMLTHRPRSTQDATPDAYGEPIENVCVCLGIGRIIASMRTFVSVVRDDALDHTVYLGRFVSDQYGGKTDQLQRRITRVRYEAEAAAIAAGEPVRQGRFSDADFFGMLAVERARDLAQRVLDEIGE